MSFQCPPLTQLEASLDPERNSRVERLPVAQRMRAAYWLKHVYDHASASDSETRVAARRALEAGMLHPPHGSLLRHEAAYVLGQLRDKGAQRSLEVVLADEDEDAMLRHECAEALGGIGVGEELLTRLAEDKNAPDAAGDLGARRGVMCVCACVRATCVCVRCVYHTHPHTHHTQHPHPHPHPPIRKL